jgi:hypothetical protein
MVAVYLVFCGCQGESLPRKLRDQESRTIKLGVFFEIMK